MVCKKSIGFRRDAGFIGSNIIENLIKKKICKITATYFKKKPTHKMQKSKLSNEQTLLNHRDLKKFDKKYDLIFMCAGKIFNKSSGLLVSVKLKENLLINQNVIELPSKKNQTLCLVQ